MQDDEGLAEVGTAVGGKGVCGLSWEGYQWYLELEERVGIYTWNGVPLQVKQEVSV